MGLAPIVLFVYNRVEVTKRTLTCLKANKLAQDSDLYIYSDGGKDEISWKSVNCIREYLKTITGIKSVTIIERDIN